ncbi:MAG: amidohydrolase family protein, partial [Chloroflexi bacterium]|nr:amidohydrolase family protein [Chloroflexota bacterium]
MPAPPRPRGLAGAISVPWGGAMLADLVLLNGRIYTQCASRPWASALAAFEGTIVHVGDDASARELASSRALTVDLKGRCALPGLADAHLHLGSFAESLTRVDAETPTLELALARVAERAADTPPGQWVLGRGWNHNVWGGAFPTAAHLDGVAPDRPVLLGAKSGHAAWMNSRAMALAGITAETVDPPGGEIVRDAEGRPTGILLEGAMGLVWPLVPETSLDEMAAAMPRAIAAAHRAGLTSVHDMDGVLAFRAEQALRERGELTLRILKSIPLERLDEAIALGVRTGLGDDWLRLGQVKMFADGALGPRT